MSIDHIGKEANDWERQFYLETDADEQINYGAKLREDLYTRIESLCVAIGERSAVEKLGIARGTLRKLR